ncbi:MAG: CinA family protein [Methylotetracoccus sp.]|jgi:nicotinamide-nucleotide amidase|nr:CinA family protein [Methylotetracoccus sp.]
MNDTTLYGLAEQVGTVLRERGERLATAESCTGGGIAQAVTDVPGSSDWFECGLVTYSNGAKQRLLGVPEAVLDRSGAVSEETVCAMAAGALRQTEATLAVAVSGIAGPAGGTPGKPVGTVWLAWLSRDGAVRKTAKLSLDGDRLQVRRLAVEAALRGILDAVGG